MNTHQKLISGCVALVACTVCTPGFAQVGSGSAKDWLDGKALQKARSLPVSISWTDSPLRTQLIQFGNQRQRPIFVDRRVDPTLKQTLKLFEATTEQVIWRTARENDLGVARVGNLFYVGPKSSASKLTFAIAAAKKDLSKLGKDVRRKWNKKSDILWPNATTTTEVASWFELNHGVRFADPIPFDVWPAADWPELSLLEQMSLVLIGFDKSFEIADDGQTVSLVKFPAVESGTRKFKFKEEPFPLNEARSKFPDLKFATSGKTLSVKGGIENLAELEAWVVQQQKITKDERSIGTFTLNTTALRGDILATVVDQTERKLELKGNAGELLNQPITVNLEKVTLESLIEVCLEGTGLKYNLSNSRLTISDK